MSNSLSPPDLMNQVMMNDLLLMEIFNKFDLISISKLKLVNRYWRRCVYRVLANCIEISPSTVSKRIQNPTPKMCICRLQFVNDIDLNWKRFESFVAGILRYTPNLKVLRIIRGTLNSDHVRLLFRMPFVRNGSLQQIDLYENRFLSLESSTDVFYLLGHLIFELCPNLKRLRLDGRLWSDMTTRRNKVNAIPPLPHLETLEIETRLLYRKALDGIERVAPQLKKMKLFVSTSSESFNQLIPRLQLVELDLCTCHCLQINTVEFMQTIARNLGDTLESLRMEGFCFCPINQKQMMAPFKQLKVFQLAAFKGKHLLFLLVINSHLSLPIINRCFFFFFFCFALQSYPDDNYNQIRRNHECGLMHFLPALASLSKLHTVEAYSVHYDHFSLQPLIRDGTSLRNFFLFTHRKLNIEGLAQFCILAAMYPTEQFTLRTWDPYKDDDLTWLPPNLKFHYG